MLKKRKKSPYWYAVIYDGGNKRRWVSTKTTSESEARVMHDLLNERFKQLRAEDHRRRMLGLEKECVKPVLIDEIIKYYKTMRGDAPSTTLKNFNRFIDWLKKVHPEITDARQITKAIALDYLSRYNKSSAKTYNNNRGTLASIWSQLTVYDIKNIWAELPLRRGAQSVKYRAYTQDEVERILNCTSGFWHSAIIIAYHTGLRLSDICHLKHNCINWKDETIELTPSKTSRFKRSVYIHLHQDVIQVLKQAVTSNPNNSEYVFPVAVRQYGSGSFQKQFKTALNEAKISDNKYGKASFHSLRSTFITNCEEAGIDRKVIQGIVGHRSPSMTEHYSEDKKSGMAIKELPSINVSVQPGASFIPISREVNYSSGKKPEG